MSNPRLSRSLTATRTCRAASLPNGARTIIGMTGHLPTR
jgi:hypothetical protein